jgi:type VI secretion system protein ImpK
MSNEDNKLTDNQLPNTTDPTAAQKSVGLPLSTDSLSNALIRKTSKAFEIKVSLNPLIAACAPIFIISKELHQKRYTHGLDELKTLLIGEVKVFENKAHHLGYSSPIILAARYLLCAYVDESIKTSTWGKQANWEDYSLLTAIQGDNSLADQRFFAILDRGASDAKNNIDLLELGYLCLSLGFKGKYNHAPHTIEQLAKLLDDLYHVINDVRGDTSKTLLVGPTAHIKPKFKTWRVSSLWITAIATIAIITSLYIPYRANLNKMTKPITQLLNQISQPNSATVE